jgi:hypothetical protein
MEMQPGPVNWGSFNLFFYPEQFVYGFITALLQVED